MIKVENIDVYGFEAAIRGMRNPKNSWVRSDSHPSDFTNDGKGGFVLGANDLDLMQNLSRAGRDHRKFLRMITVTMDITAPVYWVLQFDTYKVGTTKNSCSLQHTGANDAFTIQDFSIEERFQDLPVWNSILEALEKLRLSYKDTKDYSFFKAMRSIIPMGFNYRFTWAANYEVLLNIYQSRKNHKLDEWREFCKIIKTLPYFQEITGV